MPTMYVNLKSYLSKLKAVERGKPKDRQRVVPSLAEIARSIDMHQTSLSRLANNQVNQLNLETGAKIITEMRERGFDMDVSDLLVYVEN